MMDRTGFSADQGSLFDSSLISMASGFSSPEPVRGKMAMCVQTGASDPVSHTVPAGGNSKSAASVDDDNASNASLDSASQILLLKARLKAQRSKATAAQLQAAAEETELQLQQALLDSSSRSHRSKASSRRSGRNLMKDLGGQDGDGDINLSRELSTLMKQEFAEKEPQARGPSTEATTTAPSAMNMPSTSYSIPKQELRQEPFTLKPPGDVDFVIGTPGTSAHSNPKPLKNEAGEPAVRNEPAYGPARERSRGRSEAPFERNPKKPQTPRSRSATRIDLEGFKVQAEKAATEQAVTYLQELHDKLAHDSRAEISQFESLAEERHLEIITQKESELHMQYQSGLHAGLTEIASSAEEQLSRLRQELDQQRNNAIAGERERVRKLAEDAYLKAKQELERQAATRTVSYTHLTLPTNREV